MNSSRPSDPAPKSLLAASGLTEQMGFVLRLAYAAVWDDLVKALSGFGLRPVHYSVMAIARTAPGCRQQDVGDALGIQRPNLVAIINLLEERGLLLRQPHPDDRRSHALFLTDEGSRTLDAMRREQAIHAARIDSALTGPERDALMIALAKLARLGGNASL